MTTGYFTLLPERGFLLVEGPEAEHFLQNLITCEVEALAGAAFGALLTPQGKILFDFLVYATEKGFLLEAPKAVIPDLKKRLGFYKLRAKLEITEPSSELTVAVVWDLDEPPSGPFEGALAGPAADPRLADLGQRIIGTPEQLNGFLSSHGLQYAEPQKWHAHRIMLGVPEGGTDFEFSDIFPHDADMDQLNGISFKKGCYIGQEIVSRMEHRGTARKRFVMVAASVPLPGQGADITTDEKTLASLGSTAGSRGLALIRLDKVKAAMDNNTPIMCGNAELTVSIPEWARFEWPDNKS